MEIKIIVVGCFGVGKTSILHKLKTGTFAQGLETTVAIDYVSRRLEVEGTQIKVQFWDTAGQEKYSMIAEQFYRRAQGCLIVVSCQVPPKQAVSSFQKYLNLSQERESTLPSLLLLNKRDLADSNYLQQLKKCMPDIEAIKNRYPVTDFRVVSAKCTQTQEFLTIFEKFVMEILRGRAKLTSKSDIETRTGTGGCFSNRGSKLNPSTMEIQHSDCCS